MKISQMKKDELFEGFYLIVYFFANSVGFVEAVEYKE